MPNIANRWYNIMSFTNGGDGKAIPNVYLHTAANGVTYLSIAISKKREFWHTQANQLKTLYHEFRLELNKDYNVNLVQKTGVFHVIVDGSELWKAETGSTLYRNVRYYLSAPSSPQHSAKGLVNLGTIKVNSSNGVTPSKRIRMNRLVQTIDTWGPDFQITFDMRIVRLPMGLRNILHFTTGKTIGGTKEHIPALFLLNSSGIVQLEIIMGEPDAQYTKFIDLELKKNYSINLVQRNGVFNVQVNDSDMWKVKNKNGSKVYRNVKYFLSNPWQRSAGHVADFGTFKVVSGNGLRIITAA